MNGRMTFMPCVCLTIAGVFVLALAPGLSGILPENASARDKEQLKSAASRLVTSPSNQVGEQIRNQGGVATGATIKFRWLDAQVGSYPSGTSGADTADLTIPCAGPGGQPLWLAIYIGGWAPDTLSDWQATLDSNTLPAGVSVYRPSCTDDADCEALMGTGISAGCNVAPIADDTCSPAFVDSSRADAEVFLVLACNIVTDNLKCGGDIGAEPAHADPGSERYGGTFVLLAEQSLVGGTHTLDFVPPDGDTFMNNGNITVKTSSATLTIGTEFLGLCHKPLGGAILTLVGDTLVVSNLAPSVATASTTAAECTAPTSGVKIEHDDPQKTGDDGFMIKLDDTVIPDDVTSYFVDIEEYWGTTATNPDWVTDPIPIGFSTGGGKITGCANFDVCPINCMRVKVRFRGGNSPGTIECPSGNLFSVPDTTTIKLQKLIAHGTCPGGGCSDEAAAKDKTTLQFKLANIISGIERGDGCTGDSGPFTANRIYIQPDRTSCSEVSSCSAASNDLGVPETTDEAVAAGGRTPPIRRIKLLVAADLKFHTAAGTLGQFTILDEGFCTATDTDCFDNIPTVSGWGLMAMSLLSLIAGTLVLKRRTVALS